MTYYLYINDTNRFLTISELKKHLYLKGRIHRMVDIIRMTHCDNKDNERYVIKRVKTNYCVGGVILRGLDNPTVCALLLSGMKLYELPENVMDAIPVDPIGNCYNVASDFVKNIYYRQTYGIENDISSVSS